MSVQPGPTDKRYAANGVSTIYAVPFLVIEAGDLKVYLNGVLVTSGYTHTGLGLPASSITFTVAPVGDLYFVLSVPFQRLIDYQENGDFLAGTVNRDFDRIWQALKQLLFYSTRSLKLGENDVDGFGSYRAKGNSISDLKDPVNDQDASTKHWSRIYLTALISQIQGPINNALNIFYKGPDNLNYVVQDLSGPDGASLIGRGVGTVESALDDIESLSLVLKAKSDGTDQTTVVQDFFARVLAEDRSWTIPPGDYVINPTSPIVIKTSGVCNGRFLVPKSNQTFRFDILRDVAGTVIPTGSWTALQRGTTNANALNAVGKNLFISSTEVLIERIGSGGAPYLKQEFIRCPLPGGIFSTAIVRNYNFNTSLTVTAHTPSKPISIKTLSVLLTGASGGVESNRGTIVVTRDNVVLEQPSVINADPAQPRPVAIEVSYCADVTLNQPHVRGFNYNGLGYGIINGTTIGLTVNQPVLEDCRHAYTGAFTVDVVLNGGTYSRIIDDHWTDRFTANDCKVYAQQGASAFEFAGDDVTINNPQQFGGRSCLGIRVDTPSLGGKVIIKNPRIQTRGEVGAFHLFGFSSPGGPGPIGFGYTNKPRLPDLVVIEDARIDSDTAVVYGAYLGSLLAPHTTWGEICLRGEWSFTGSTVVGIFAEKNANYQQDRRTMLVNEARMNCGPSGSALYVVALDANASNSMDARVENVLLGKLQFTGNGVNFLRVLNSTITDIVNNSTSEIPNSLHVFSNCNMAGGAVNALIKNLSFQGCQFTGNYSAFPAAANVTMVGNIKTSTVTGLPADIRNNIVAPYN